MGWGVYDIEYPMQSCKTYSHRDSCSDNVNRKHNGCGCNNYSYDW